MNIPKQFINLLGGVLVVVILVAGVALIALPMYSGSQVTDGQTKTVAQTNSVYQIQVTQLQTEAATIDETTARVDELRREITVIPQLDDVFEIVVAAAEDTDATITNVSASDPQPWAPRVPAEGTVPVEAPVEEPADDGSVIDDAEAVAETPAPTEPAAPAADSPQQQVPVTIAVTVEDADAAAAFIDALGQGPRLLSPLDATYSGDTLTVNVLAFIRAED